MTIDIIPPDIGFEALFRKYGEQESQNIHWGSYWRQSLLARIENGPSSSQGVELPWHKFRTHFRLRPGELTVWAGEDGSRKSLILGQVMLHVTHTHQHRATIMSLEMEPEVTLERMAQQAVGCLPSREYMDLFIHWTDDKIALYDQLDTVKPEAVLGVVYFSALDLNCQHVVIDSLMKCTKDIEDYAASVRFVDQLARAAKHLKIHIHLVHHMKKSDSANDRGKGRIYGSSQMLNHAHNVVTIWYNEARYEALEAKTNGNNVTEAQQKQIDEKYDQLLSLRKQRMGPYPKHWGLYFDERSLQLTEAEGGRKVLPLGLNEDKEYEPGAVG